MTTTTPEESGRRTRSFVHPALFYRQEEEFLDGVAGFLRQGIEAGRPAFVAVPAARLALLRDRMGPLGADVTWLEMNEVGRNPGRILSALQGFADLHPAGAHLVGEPIWHGRSPEEIREATRHEALINLAFAGRPVSILCPYDVSVLPDDVVSDAYRTHPVIAEGADNRGNDLYTDPLEVCADCDTPLPEPPADVRVLHYKEGDLGPVRAAAEGWARGLGMSERRRTDLTLAVSEATTNSVRHGGGSGTLRLWRVDGTAFLETSDRGYLANPLLGRRRPDPVSAAGGRGLWLIHQLCDLVEIRARPDGLVLRMSFGID
jgi:anti-sigma regulatory factor (Ser/Thr protein kinase)